MRNRNRSFVGLHQDRLGVQQRRISRGRVARVPNGQRSPQLGQDILDENIRHQSHGFMGMQRHPIGGHDPRRLLPPMLQGMQAQVSKLLRLRVRIDGDDTAFFMKFVGISH